MFLYLSLTVVLCLVSWIYVKWSRVKNFWPERGVPQSPPLPIIGNVPMFRGENMGTWLMRMKREFKGPYVGMWLFWKPGLIINCPKIGRNVMVKDFEKFRNRHLSSGDTDPIGGLNIFTVNDPLWTNLRRQLTAIFTPAKLRNIQDYVSLKSKEVVQKIHKEKDNKIALRDMYIDFATDIIGTSAFGVKSDAVLTSGGPMRDITRDFSYFSIYRSFCWISIFFVPELVDVFRFKFFPRKSTEYLKKIFKTLITRREVTTESDHKDLVGALLKIRNENPSYSDDVIIAQAAIMLLAGFETSASVMTFATYELAHYPHIQEKLYNELKEARDKNNSDNFDLQLLTDLPYLDCVVKECLRKYPPMGWIDRIANSDYTVDDNLTIEAGTVVYVNSIGMHYDAEYFPKPHEFNPDRFLPENKHSIDQYTYLPFGEGPRYCIGKKFAIMTIQYVLSSILLNFELRPKPGTPKPIDVTIDSTGILYIPGEPLFVDFVPRK